MAAFSVSPTEQTYREVENLIYRICWKFSQFGLEFEECVSVANQAFVECYNSFDPHRGAQFSTWLYHGVTHALQDFRDKEQTYHRRIALEDQLTYEVEDIRQHRLADIMGELSDDARVVVQAVVESPKELKAVLRCHKPQNLRRGLCKHFRELGWSLGRTAECFDEIREVLAR